MKVVGEPARRICLTSNLQISRNEEKPYCMAIYDEHGYPQVSIMVRAFLQAEGYQEAPVTIPQEIAIGYIRQRAAIKITLTDVKLNVPLDGAQFRLNIPE